MSMEADFAALLPELFLLAGAVTALLTGSFLPRDRQSPTRLIGIIALLGAVVSTGTGLSAGSRTVFEGSFSLDTPTTIARLIICTATLLVICLGADELRGSPRESETYALMLLSTLGALVMAGTDDLLILAVAYLLASIPLYALIGMGRSPRAAEAALKTYLLGAFLGIALLLGITILYALAGASSYDQLRAGLADAPSGAIAAGLLGVLAGIAFKAGAVPGHFWVPDASQGAGVAVAAFLTTVPKIGALVAAYRLLSTLPDSVDAPLVIAVLAAASMTIGNFAAFSQTNVRRLLGWSTVSQAGYLLVPVAVAGASDLALPSLLFYLGAYALSNIGAFAVVAATGHDEVGQYRGLARRSPWLAGVLVVSLLSLVGTPPTVVFVGKLTTFAAGWDGGLAWLVVVAALNTVASLFYYLRWLAPMFQGAEFQRAATESTEPSTPDQQAGDTVGVRRWPATVAVLSGGLVVAGGVVAGLVWPALEGTLAGL
ncbi:NADH-quinone oxidoreductase subunit N [Arthrobacter echini]|uniref:NADH-quinone oxidoreductase subunit N n=1 Tax=Arthrobacter echini TaxID=1529066 RepID=A0A4S5E4P7_9MICC|nr:NADH-quinone oxidoreductase subunit N [Arthrobacter echini]THJ66447.1 NADH-quinone oxidoreductase subunit N [Arthrobacter echini]